MSTNPPAGRPSPQVYRRRRVVVLLVLLAVVAAIVLIIVRPGASQGEEPSTGDGKPAATDATKTSDPESTTIPTEPTAADGDPCAPEQIVVEPITDKSSYEAGQQPQLSVTIENTGKNVCVLNAGTKAQVFTITSGDDVYWMSTDCQVDAIDAEVSLQPGKPISSSSPIAWDRTRSSKDTCEGPRESVPAGGASYYLAVSIDGFDSAEKKQFLLY
ncbi:hypothetical protein PX701_02785 [Agromyces sp. H3Y2-19a]|uniref:hypothetical protein n=1 Tax=Agromyces chromiiresistens TaxID=3030835 RepID=UPI0023B9B46F|nr:hypothetical protein [Agromyces chromiiresistens]MDF0512537.1 hypothetical protein [Agromyces chromiiresistens]